MANETKAPTVDALPRCTVCNEQKAPRGAWIAIECWAMCHEERGCPGYAQEPDARDHWPEKETKPAERGPVGDRQPFALPSELMVIVGNEFGPVTMPLSEFKMYVEAIVGPSFPFEDVLPLLQALWREDAHKAQACAGILIHGLTDAQRERVKS